MPKVVCAKAECVVIATASLARMMSAAVSCDFKIVRRDSVPATYDSSGIAT